MAKPLRFVIRDSEHQCCFAEAVFDTEKEDGYQLVCDCVDHDTAETIARLLNAAQTTTEAAQ